MVEICREYKWDFYTYIAQPSWFIDLIESKMMIDTKKAKAQANK